MSILDGLLGGNNDSSSSNESYSESNQTFAANPNLDLSASDVLHFADWNQDGGDNGGGDMSATELVGVGDIGLGASSPIYASNDSKDYQNSESYQDGNGGGLLSGLI